MKSENMEKKKIQWNVIITIIISITGVFVSWQAYKVSKLQSEIARNSLLPNIQINEKDEPYDSTDNEYQSIIEILNLEGKINNYSSRVVTFLECDYVNDKESYNSQEVPVFNYYIWHRLSGNITGTLEEMGTAYNQEKIKKLQKDILAYNKKTEESLYVQLKSYVRIEYKDLLNEDQTLYYCIDTLNTTCIEESEGNKAFKKYDTLLKNEIGIDLNINDSIPVNQLIDKIHSVSKEKNIEKKKTKRREKEDGIVNELISVIIGAILAYFFAIRQEKKRQEYEISHAASVLYYDLKSIEYYLKEETSFVNLRYSQEWQSVTAVCSFLGDENVNYIYQIYDIVYNYNEYYRQKQGDSSLSKKEDIPQYEQLKNKMFRKDSDEYTTGYEKVLNELKNKE